MPGRYLAILFAILIAFSSACGKTETPFSPAGNDVAVRTSSDSSGGKVLWGMYDVTIDPATMQAEIVPIRGAEFTVNVTMFMQPPISKTNLLSIKIDTGSDLANGLVICDVSLRHPFPSLPYYRGFDVYGICMGDGSSTLGHDTSAVYAGPTDLVVNNADGYTRWWNSSEFAPKETIFGYQTGKLAPKNYTPTAILNGYKYFADGLGPDDPLAIDPSTRGTFTAGSVNTRKYEIQFPKVGGVPVYKFAYAVEANWEVPDPSGAPTYPIDSFPGSANASEPYMIKATDAGSTAWYVDPSNNGGSLKLDVEIFDWQAPTNPLGVKGELAGLWIEGESISAPVDVLQTATVLPGGPTSSIFEFEISNLNLTHSGASNLWVIAESASPNTYEPQFGGNTSAFTWPSAPLAAYLRTSAEIAGVQPQTAPVVLAIDPTEGDVDATVPATVTGQDFQNGAQVELRQSGAPTPFVIAADSEAWIDSTTIDCSLNLTGAPVGAYDVVVINPDLMEGSLDAGFTVKQSNVIYVDDSNASGTEDGTQAHPYNTIQEGLTAASSGWQVWVDDSGLDYAEQVTMKSGVILKSVNWDTSDGGDEASIKYEGGGAAVTGANSATIQGFKIDGNSLGLECSATSPEILNCRVVNITGPQWGSGIAIYIHAGALPHLDNVTVDDVSNADGLWESLYGILIDSCPAIGSDKVVIEHTTVHYLHTTGLIGGSYCSPYGIYINASNGVEISNTIVNNVSSGNYNDAFGIYSNLSDNVKLVNSVIYEVDKYYYYGTAYGLYLSNCAGFDARNLIISHIHRGEGGTGGYYQSGFGATQVNSTSYAFVYCDVYDCDSGNYNGLTSGVGCISQNAMYVNPGTDFKLNSGSPCINTGDPAISDTDSSRSDMGAYGGPEGDW